MWAPSLKWCDSDPINLILMKLGWQVEENQLDICLEFGVSSTIGEVGAYYKLELVKWACHEP